MGRRKVVTEEVFEPGDKPDDAEIALADPADVISDELSEILGADDGEDNKYTVHKMPTKPGEREAYCNVYSRSELSLDSIRATFGGGTYRITGRNAKNQYVTSKRVTLLELPKTAGSVVGGAPSADLAAILAAAKPSDGGMMPVLIELIRSMNKPAVAPPPGPSVMEIIAMIKTLQPEKDSGGEAVKMLLQGLELGKSIGGGGETGMLDVAKQGLEMLGPLVAREAAPRPQPRPRPRPNGQAPTETEAIAAPIRTNPTPQEAPNPMLQKLAWITNLTKNLVVHAIKEHDPETYAEVVLDNLPPFVTEEEILQRLTPDNAVAQLSQLNPDVAKYAAWFEEFRQAVIRFLTEDDEAPPDGEVPADFVPEGDLEP